MLLAVDMAGSAASCIAGNIAADHKDNRRFELRWYTSTL